MISRVLTYYVGRLDDYLSRRYHRPEGMASVGQVFGASAAVPNKVGVSLVNLEREASGDGMRMRRFDNACVGMLPPMLLNMYILVSAVYDRSMYAESLHVLYDTLCFIHSMPRFEVAGYRYTSEVISESVTSMHDIWTTMGGTYYPSVMCKLRGLVVDSGTMIAGSTTVHGSDVNMQ